MKLICLANSYKSGGRCVAGIEPISGRWIRPVSKGVNGALSSEQSSAINGGTSRPVRPLDLIEIGIVKPCPAPNQPENVEVGASKWRIEGKVALSDLGRFVIPDGPLLHGTTDRVAESDARGIGASLCIIKVERPTFYCRPRSGIPQLRATFEHSGVQYDLAVTDTEDWVNQARWEPSLFSKGTWLFTISLGENYRSFHYKLVACGLLI